ncbi:MAG: hypothetical protein Q4P24_04930 [Rhodobacterales bacterium]|nr:hypothetical protein [Rhodobacterales bacterium]
METQRGQLVEILSDIPTATILATANHQIVLYDGQAAAFIERVGVARLKASVFDYLEKWLHSGCSGSDGCPGQLAPEDYLTSHCGRIYSGHIPGFGAGSGSTLMVEPLK